MSYLATCLADSPSLLWLLNDTTGTTAADSSGNGHTGTYTVVGAGSYTLNETNAPWGLGCVHSSALKSLAPSSRS